MVVLSGTLPTIYNSDINLIADTFEENIPDDIRESKSFHLWTENMQDPKLQHSLDQIRFTIQKKIIESCKFRCVVRPIKSMDELYYSFPPKQQGENVYGDAGLFNHHIDGMFPDILNTKVYRVIVGLTPNDSVFTVFPDKKQALCLNKGDYLGFDFNHDAHFVSGSVTKNDRLILKLHFVKCEPCSESQMVDKQLQIISDVHKAFEDRSREFMSYGARPETPLQYVAGYSTQILTWIRVNLVYLSLFAMIIMISLIINSRKIETKH